MTGVRESRGGGDRTAVLDLRGLGLDFSLLKVISALGELSPGQTLEVLTLDRTISDRLADLLARGTDRLLRIEPRPGFQKLLLRRD